MNPEILAEIVARNGSDIEAIVNALGGLGNLLKLWPHISNILATVQEAQKPK